MRSMLPSSVRSHRRALRAAAARAVLEAVEARQFLSATVSGTVFADANKDGVRQSGEAGVGGKVVFADYNGNGAVDAGEPSATTGSTGAYTLPGIKSDFSSVGVRLAGTAAADVVKPSGGVYYARYNNGDSRTGLNFALVPAAAPATASYYVTVVNDTNGNGAADAGEGTFTNARVYVDANGNGSYDVGERTALTNASGNAQLLIPADTDVTIRATLAGSSYDPSAFTQTAPAGGSYVGNLPADGVGSLSFAFAPKVVPPAGPSATLSGSVARDTDRSGTWSAGDATVMNQTVFADYNGNGAVDGGEPSTVTDINGGYELRGVKADHSSVALRLLGVPASDVVAPGGGIYYARYGPGDVRSSLNFALKSGLSYTPGAIAFHPYFDANGNGTPDDATGPRDATVWIDTNGNGLEEAGEPSLAIIGGPYGLPDYETGDLAPGTYTVALRLAGDADSYSDYNTSFTVTDGQRANVYRAIPTTSTNRGTVYSDANGNGTRDSGEAGLSGVTVFADYDFDRAIDAGEPSTTTASDGSYALKGIRADNNPFRLTLAGLPSGAAVTAPAAGYYQARYDRAYDLGGINFGVKPASAPTSGSIAFRPYYDTNEDGSPNGETTGPADATVWIDSNVNGLRDAAEPLLTLTSSGGVPTFSISNLPAGTDYPIAIRLAGDVDNYSDYPFSAAVQAGQTTTVYGRIPTRSTNQGYVFYDANGDGALGSDEARAAGVTVFADYDFDGVLDAGEPSATTNSTGYYAVLGIRSDNQPFRLTLANLPSGTTVATPTAGYYQARYDRAYNVANIYFTLKAGPVETAPGAISVTPFLDADNDGALDAGEYTGPLYGVWLDLDRDGYPDSDEPQLDIGRPYDGTTREVLTYTASGLAPGSYRVGIRLTGDPDSIADYTVDATVSSSAPHPSFDVPLATGSISGRAFVDNDYSGTFTPGDTTAAGVTVFASLQGTPYQRLARDPYTASAADGTFTIVGVPIGQEVYVATAGLPGGRDNWRFTATPAAAAGAIGGLSVFAQPDRAGTGSVSGRVYGDANRNGALDYTTDTYYHMANYNVYADLNYNGVRDAGEPTSYTDFEGRYTVRGLPADGRSVAIRLLDVPASRVTAPAGGAHSLRVFNETDYAGRDFGIIL